MRTTPKISLSLSEFGQLVIGLGVLGWTMTLAVVTRSPWRVFMSADKRRAFLREIANVMIRTGGYWLSIRHLQFMMPSTRSTIRTWGFMNWTKVHSEEVLSSDTLVTTSTEINPWVHWIGEKPTRGEPSIDGKVLLYIHGGGFVLPLSSGHLAMVTTLLREAKAKSSKPIYLAVAEYTIAPYAQHPTQIKQCISVIRHLYSQYGVDSSDIVIAGDSCGGALSLSILSHFLHPEPSLPPLPYDRGTNKPFAGMLLISPWASFCTTSPSYTINAERDTLPPNIIQRFRDTYISHTPLLPTTQSSPMKVASVTGRYYESVQDPVIIGLDRGVGLIRPIGSFKKQAGRDQWWDGLGSVVSRVLITSGEMECFRDDIITLVNTMKSAASQDNTVTLDSIEDDSFHAVLVSDFAFGAPLSTFAAKLSGWLVDTLVDPEEAQ